MTQVNHIASVEKMMEGVINFAVFDGCLGSAKMRPTDIDGACERRGQFLFIEKKGIGVRITTGQRILFEALWKEQSPDWPMGNKTILYIFGSEYQPMEVQLLVPGRKHYAIYQPQPKVIPDIMRLWYKAADSRTVPDFTGLVNEYRGFQVES